MNSRICPKLASVLPPELVLGTGEENFRPRCCVHTRRGFTSPFEYSEAVFGQEGLSGQLVRIFVMQTFWQTLQGRTCTCKYSDKLSCSYLEFKRLKKQLWEKRGIFLKEETLKGLGGFFSQFPLGDSCCSAIFFLCLVLMSSDGDFGLFCCFFFFLILFFPFEHELKSVGASEYRESCWGRSRQCRAFGWGSDIVDFSPG